jgi:hypothetical protein
MSSDSGRRLPGSLAPAFTIPFMVDLCGDFNSELLEARERVSVTIKQVIRAEWE